MGDFKNRLIKKIAEAKSAILSKEAANNSVEKVLTILFTVIIAIGVGAAMYKILFSDSENSTLNQISALIQLVPFALGDGNGASCGG